MPFARTVRPNQAHMRYRQALHELSDKYSLGTESHFYDSEVDVP